MVYGKRSEIEKRITRSKGVVDVQTLTFAVLMTY